MYGPLESQDGKHQAPEGQKEQHGLATRKVKVSKYQCAKKYPSQSH